MKSSSRGRTLGAHGCVSIFDGREFVDLVYGEVQLDSVAGFAEFARRHFAGGGPDAEKPTGLDSNRVHAADSVGANTTHITDARTFRRDHMQTNQRRWWCFRLRLCSLRRPFIPIPVAKPEPEPDECKQCSTRQVSVRNSYHCVSPC